VDGFRRVFAHTAPIFFERGVARPETGEISSLSCEEAPGHSIVVSVFEIAHTAETIEVGCASGFPHQQDTSRSTSAALPEGHVDCAVLFTSFHRAPHRQCLTGNTNFDSWLSRRTR